MDDEILVSVIVPSLDGDAERLDELRNTLMNSGLARDQFEMMAVIGVSPNGRARDRGTIEASGRYLLFLDDDVSFPDATDLKDIVTFLDTHEDAGLCGPAQQIPPELSGRERSRAEQLPRAHVEVVDQFRETDMVTHACLCISRRLFYEIGMEHPNLISGTDPDLREKVRREGDKVGLVPGTRVFHPPLSDWRTMIEKNFTGGRRSRAVKREYPEYHLSAEPDRTEAEGPEGNTLCSRVQRHLGLLQERILQMELFGLSAQVAYQLGYGWESVFPAEWVDRIPYPNPSTPEQTEWEDFVNALSDEGRIKWLHRP